MFELAYSCVLLRLLLSSSSRFQSPCLVCAIRCAFATRRFLTRPSKISGESSSMMRRASGYCLLLVICCLVVLVQSARLTEQSIDLLPTADTLLKETQEPRHLSGYFTVRLTSQRYRRPILSYTEIDADLTSMCSSTEHSMPTCFTFSLRVEASKQTTQLFFG